MIENSKEKTMAEKWKETAVIKSQTQLAEGIYDMWLLTKQIASFAKAGQFISVYCNDGSRLLPRPISICEIDQEKQAVRIVYRIAGKGTDEFSKLKEGEFVDILGPLGNGFPLIPKKALIIGGGIGIPPMLELSKQISSEKEIVLGYRDALFLNHEFEAYGNVSAATEDGSAGEKGNVLDVIRKKNLTADVMYACGPTPMLRALKVFAAEQGIEAYLSLEEKMACGVGACLACVCQSKEVDGHSHVKNKRICKDGPVFLASEVEI